MRTTDLLAQGVINGLGIIGTTGAGPGTFTTLASLLSAAVGLMTVIAGIYFLFIILSSAIAMISSGGDKGTYEEARKKITHGFIGLTVSIAAIFILGLIGIILGVPLLDIQQIQTF